MGLIACAPPMGALVHFKKSVRLRPYAYITPGTFSVDAPRVPEHTSGIVVAWHPQPGRLDSLGSAQVMTPLGLGWVFIDELDVDPTDGE